MGEFLAFAAQIFHFAALRSRWQNAREL